MQKSNNFMAKIRSYDAFGQRFSMKVDKEKMEQQSYMGFFLTVVLTIFVLSFFITKILTLVHKHEVDIMSALLENAIDQDYQFTHEDGLFVAAALTQFDAETESIEDWRYGELIFEQYGWGYDSSIKASNRRLDYHACSDEELGLV